MDLIEYKKAKNNVLWLCMGAVIVLTGAISVYRWKVETCTRYIDIPYNQLEQPQINYLIINCGE